MRFTMLIATGLLSLLGSVALVAAPLPAPTERPQAVARLTPGQRAARLAIYDGLDDAPAHVARPPAAGRSSTGSDPHRGAPGTWLAGFCPPSVDGQINATCTYQGNTIAAGAFVSIGGIEARNIAKWDGVRWTDLGNGLPGEVECLAVYRDRLIAGGSFAGDPDSAEYLAQWDGNNWLPLGHGVDGAVFALAVYDDALMVGGAFQSADGKPANQIAQWDGTAWQPLGIGIGDEEYVSEAVQCMTVHKGALIVGGTFFKAGTVNAYNIAQWDGISWSPMASGLYGQSEAGVVESLVSFGTDLIAGGNFMCSNDCNLRNVASWDGASWHSLSSGIWESVNCLVVFEGTLLAGSRDLWKWTGSSWATFPVNLSYPRALRVDNGTLIAAADFPYGPPGQGIGSWDGIKWCSLGGGLSSPVFTLSIANGHLLAGGQLRLGSSGGAAQWDGTQWSGFGSGPNVDVRAIANFGGQIIAGGTCLTSCNGSDKYLRAWNGTSWSALGSGVTNSVRGLAVWQSNLVAGGEFTTAGGMSCGSVAQWDGTAWYPLSTLNNQVRAITSYDGNLIAAGWFTRAESPPLNYIAKYDNGSWSPLGDGLDDKVECVTEYNGMLVAGGRFTHAGGIQANHVAAWDGSSWSPLGTGTDDYVLALATYHGDLIAGGAFQWVGADSCAHVARWDGSSWSPFPVGTDDWVLALATLDDRLYMGGFFTAAGGNVASHIASWEDDVTNGTSAEPPLPAGSLHLEPSAPNPFRTWASVTYSLSAPGFIAAHVYDPSGRRVATLANQLEAAGRHTLRWDGHSGIGDPSATGIYFVRVQAGNDSKTTRVVLIR